MSSPEIAVVVTTYQRPWHLRRVLLSLVAQRDLPGPPEIVVADDGSTDETPQVVEDFRKETGLNVKFVTHPHEGFCPSRARNEGFAQTAARYVLFLDGDCVVPPDHLATHLRCRQPGQVMTTDCLRLDSELSRRFTEETIRSGQFTAWVPPAERRRLRRAHWKAVLYHLLRHPTKPRILSGNFCVWREDFERINGFDENYRGWGCEDDDLGLRLHQAGVRVRSLRHRTWTFHLWHPRDPSAPQKIKEGPNIAYFHRRGRLTRCRNGLLKRQATELDVAITGAGDVAASPIFRQLFAGWSEDLLARALIRAQNGTQEKECEFLFYRPGLNFRTQAECRILVLDDDLPLPRGVLSHSDVVLSPAGALPRFLPLRTRGVRVWSLDDLSSFWQSLG